MKFLHVIFAIPCMLAITACNNPKDFWTTDPPERPPHEDPYTSDPVDPALKFAMEASLINLTEIEMAGIAQKKAEHKKVKQLAESIERDHKMAQKKLKDLAVQYGWELPEDPSKQDSVKIAALKAIPGNRFDREYIRSVMDRHQEAIDRFERLASAKADPLKDTVVAESKNIQHYDIDDQKASSLSQGAVTGAFPNDDMRNWAMQALPNMREHMRLSRIILSDIR